MTAPVRTKIWVMRSWLSITWNGSLHAGNESFVGLMQMFCNELATSLKRTASDLYPLEAAAVKFTYGFRQWLKKMVKLSCDLCMSIPVWQKRSGVIWIQHKRPPGVGLLIFMWLTLKLAPWRVESRRLNIFVLECCMLPKKSFLNLLKVALSQFVAVFVDQATKCSAKVSITMVHFKYSELLAIVMNRVLYIGFFGVNVWALLLEWTGLKPLAVRVFHK